MIHEIKFFCRPKPCSQGQCRQHVQIPGEGLWSGKNKGCVQLRAAAGPSTITDLSELLDTKTEQFKGTLQARL